MHNQRMTVSKLSKLQKRILEVGLRAHWDEPIHRAWHWSEPGAFDIRLILVDFFQADEKDVSRSYWLRKRGDQRKKLAKSRATISRAISRLTKRGFLERIKPTGRGEWRLTEQGSRVAPRVCPNLNKPTRTEMLDQIKKTFLSRKRARGTARLSDSVTFKAFVRTVLVPQEPRSLSGNRLVKHRVEGPDGGVRLLRAQFSANSKVHPFIEASGPN
jgi:DNA-binding MarR family transcriptional regulator